VDAQKFAGRGIIRRHEGGMIDLSGVIIAILAILIFFGGTAWLEIRSRKNKRPVRQGVKSPQSNGSIERAMEGRLGRNE
jgi:hypothetical protein